MRNQDLVAFLIAGRAQGSVWGVNDKGKTTGREAAAEGPLAPAFYEGKEAWKAEAGNRYSAEELRAMDREWEVTVRPKRARVVRNAD